MHKYLYALIFLFSFLLSQGQKNPLLTKDSIAQQSWVEERYSEMTLEEKIGQLFMVRVASDQNKKATNAIKTLIEEEHIGGVIFSTGGPIRQAKLTNQYQKASKIPLLVGMDAEWGLSMRLDSTYAFPWNMTLGAIEDNAIVEKVGKSFFWRRQRKRCSKRDCLC